MCSLIQPLPSGLCPMSHKVPLLPERFISVSYATAEEMEAQEVVTRSGLYQVVVVGLEPGVPAGSPVSVMGVRMQGGPRGW